MTLAELNARKAALVKTILNDVDSPDILAEINALISSRLGKMPCQYTPEELKARALIAIEQMNQGEGTPHEEMKKKFTA